MKKILLSSLSYEGCYGGVENSLRYLSKSFVKSGYKVIILASSPKGEKFERVGNEDGVILVRFRRGLFENKFINLMLFPFFIFDLLLSLSFVKRNYAVDKSICRNQFICFFVNLFFAKKNTYLAPGFSHRQSAKENMTNEGITLTLRRKLHTIFDYAALRASSSVFVFSNNMLIQAEELALSFSSHDIKKKISITKPGVDKSVFYPLSYIEKREKKRFLGLPEDKVLLLCVGRCVKAKGFDLALLSLVDNEKYHLVIVGDGPEFKNLEEKASLLNVNKRVSFFGARNDVDTFYQVSDYFFMSSIYEPLGQTILEAISCALPVIAFKKGVLTATSELMDNQGVTYIEGINDEAIKSTMIKLASPDSEEYKHLSKQALTKSSLYDWNSLAQDLIN